MESRKFTPLPLEANELLGDLWQQIESDERHSSHLRLQSVAQQVSTQAYDAGLRPEELVIAVKESWMSREDLPPERDLQPLVALVNEFIGLCIAEFYLVRRVSRSSSVTSDGRSSAGPESSWLKA